MNCGSTAASRAGIEDQPDIERRQRLVMTESCVLMFVNVWACRGAVKRLTVIIGKLDRYGFWSMGGSIEVGVRLSKGLIMLERCMSETRIVSRLNYYMSTVGLKISFVGPLGVDVACEATRLRFCFVGCRLVRCAILIQHDKV